MTVIVLEEWDKTRTDRSNLLWRYVHEVNLCRLYYREVCILTTLYHVAYESTVVVQRCVALTDDVVFLLLGSEVFYVCIVQVNYAVLNLTVRSLDKAEVVDLCVHTQRRDKTDVRSFRRLDRTETTVVCIVYVTHLETSALTRQAARTQGRETTFVRHLGQRVGLVHEL